MTTASRLEGAGVEREKGEAGNWKAEPRDAADRARKVAAAAALLPGMVAVCCGVWCGVCSVWV